MNERIEMIDCKVKETAKRCQAIVFANYGYKTEKGYRIMRQDMKKELCMCIS